MGTSRKLAEEQDKDAKQLMVSIEPRPVLRSTPDYAAWTGVARWTIGGIRADSRSILELQFGMISDSA